ncbi:MAG: 3-dehydroquinate synthase [Bacillales bacterium]|nr:3-dehydroquinate synthase [Bacillales bacterium]
MELEVKLSEKSYKVVLQRGILNNLNSYYDFNNRKVLVITDDGVPSIYSEKVVNQISNSYLLVLKQGEQTKSIDSFIKIQTFLLENNFSRNDIVIALGGGVIGDLSAFCASTYKRGIKFINIPTTSLSQIDSSVGGKTAIDFLDTKNIIGTFYQPEIVLIDFDTLKTLPSRHLYNGLVEALKMGLILDEELFNIFKKNEYLSRIEEVIYLSIKRKIEVVQKDEKESFYRMILNFGHTLAHPFESVNKLENILHGEAVASGMLYMIDDQKLKKEVYRIIKTMNISLVRDYSLEEVFDYLVNDKKADTNYINVVLVKNVGQGQIVKMTYEELKERIAGEKDELNNW